MCLLLLTAFECWVTSSMENWKLLPITSLRKPLEDRSGFDFLILSAACSISNVTFHLSSSLFYSYISGIEMFCEDFEVYKEAIEGNVIANSVDISKNPVL